MKYLIPATLLISTLSASTLAGDLTHNSNEFRNEFAVGYQFGFNDSYNLGLELFSQKNPGELRVNNYALNSEEATPADIQEIWGLNDGRADLDWAGGVRLRPGYNVTGTTRLFLDGGIVWGDFSMELTDATGATALPFGDENMPTDTLRGLRYGAGIEHHVRSNSNLSLVLDYSMTEFESMNANNLTPQNNLDETNPYAPAYQQIMLSVKAEFDPGFRF